MKLNKITKKWLKTFAGDKIYQRGDHYFTSGMVYHVEYTADPLQLKAQVSGNYGNYEVIISDDGKQLHCNCDCPYDGYPCKHIVATLLSFLDKKKQHIDNANKQTNFFISLKNRLATEPHEHLVQIIIEAAQNIPEFKRTLTARLYPENTITLNTFLEQIRYINFDDFEDNYNLELEKIRKFKKILKSSDSVTIESKLIINWKIADKILDFLNQYGVSDERWEDVVIKTFDNISLLFSNLTDAEELKQDIIDQLEKYHNRGNCGLKDEIRELIDKLKMKRV